MYYFAIGAMFKNESHILKEWIEHYLFHGVDHIYLINDNSTDDFIEILQPYIDNGFITLYECEEPYYLGRQRNLYNRYFMDHVRTKDTKWFGIFDLDEFVWSLRSIDLKSVLKQCEHQGQIQINQSLFGSNGHIEQPKSVVKGFTRRAPLGETGDNLKYIVNTSYSFTSLNVHHADFENKDCLKTSFIMLDYHSDLERPCFTMNHYQCQSQRLWKEVKCTRGDSDHFLVRNEGHLAAADRNDVEDLRLYEQNKALIEKLSADNDF